MRRRLGHLFSIMALAWALASCQRVAPLVPATDYGAISGQVELRRGGTSVWVPAFDQAVLYVGDAVRTIDEAQITFSDGVVVELASGTQLEIVEAGERSLHSKSDSAELELVEAGASIQLTPRGVAVQVRTGEVRVFTQDQAKLLAEGQSAPVDTVQAPQPTAIPQVDLTSTPTLPSALATSIATPSQTPTTVSASATAELSPTTTATNTATATITNTPTVTSSPKPNAPPTATPLLAIRVNCGDGDARDGQGRPWSADRAHQEGGWGYVGGKVYTTGNSIANTESDALFQSERWGDFFYLFDVPNGTYRVTLLFAELYRNAPNERVFDVQLEGQTVAAGLDLVAVAGRDVAHVLKYTIDLRDGQLGVGFKNQIDNPKINGIMIERLR